MNSQVVSISQALKSYQTFYAVASFITISIFLSAGFISVSVIWFFAVCLYNAASRSEVDWDRIRPLWLPISLFGLSLIWMIFSANTAATGDLTLRMIHMLLIPLGFAMVNKTVSDRAFQFILTLFLGACVVCSLVCLGSSVVHVIGSGRLVDAADYFTYAALTHAVGIPPVYLGIFCSFAVLIALESPFFLAKAKVAVVMYLGGFILLISSIVSSLALLIILVLWFRSGRKSKVVLVIAFSILMLALSVSVVYEFAKRSPKVENHEMDGETVNSLAARSAVWSFAAETAKAAPITGYGPALGQDALNATYAESGFSWGVRESLNPHNQFLSTYLDLGIAGLCVLVVLIIYCFVLGFRSDDLLLLGFTMLIVVFFCFESVLVRQKGIVFFSFFYSILFARVKASDQSVVVSGGDH